MSMSTGAQLYRSLVDKLESIQQLNELAYGEEDPNNPGYMWVPNDGTTPLGDTRTQMIRTGTGGYMNAKMVPINKPAPAPVADPPEAVVTPVAEPTVDNVKPLPPAPVEPCGPEVKEKIKAQKTFNAAYAMAKQAGCPDFDWCQIVRVPEQGPLPTPASPVVTNPMGDFDPTAFSGDFTKVRETSELNQMRRIAGLPEVLDEAPATTGEIPEIKAGTKSQAIEIARKKGIKVFRFCGKYKVQAKKKPEQGPMPKPPKPVPKPTQDFQVTNPMGDFDPTAFSGQAAARE